MLINNQESMEFQHSFTNIMSQFEERKAEGDVEQRNTLPTPVDNQPIEAELEQDYFGDTNLGTTSFLLSLFSS